MKFQVAKRDLEDALKVVTPSLSSNGSDLSTHYLFRLTSSKDDGGEKGVEMLTYSGRVFSSSPLKAKVLDEGEGSFSIEGKRLKKFLGFVEDAALDFSFEDAIVTVKCPKGTQKFQSLDPSQFPFWDKQVVDAKETATLPAGRLLAALDYARNFVSDNESNDPQFCVAEARGGILYSSDRRAIILIKVAGLENAGIRIHGKSMGGFLSFLGTFPEGADVEILEHDRSILMRRGDGALFGEALFLARFPDLPNLKMDEVDDHVWTVNRDVLLKTIGFLVSGAAWEENRILVQPGDDVITLSMPNETGDKTELKVDALMEEQKGTHPVPLDGFNLDHKCLCQILRARHDLDDVRIGINQMEVGEVKKVLRGYSRFVDERDGDKYLTIHAWLT